MFSGDERLLLKVFHDYYVRNLSQNDIAARHRISRKKVQRYLEKGREHDLVEVKIRFPSRMHGALESELEDKYDLLEVMIADVDGEDAENSAMMIRNAAEMASDYFWRVLSHDMTVSVTWSGHVTEMLESALRTLNAVREKPRNVAFVLTLGSVIGSLPDMETLESARHLSANIGGDLRVVMAPGMTTTSDARDALLGDPQIAGVLDAARRADMAFFGLGAIEGDSRQVPVLRQVMPAMWDELIRLGAVGDINGRFFDAAGEPVVSGLDDRTVGLTIDDIKAMPLPVGIATGAAKRGAIRAALNGRILKVLVTDVETARKLVAEK